MRIIRLAAAVLLAVLALAMAGSAADDGAVAVAHSLRYTPIVRAIVQARPSVVAIRVPRPGGSKDALGTGVIFDERGFIVTNSHVVGKRDLVSVRLHDGTELVGEVKACEPNWDLAVVKITSEQPLRPLPFAPVTDLMVGETVIAVGHPFGYQNTVSQGIVSAVGRELTMPSGATIAGMIQTDASINPGNSGGPLLNIEGKLIGINVAIREDAHGIAFAINAATVQAVLNKHMSTLAPADTMLVRRGTDTPPPGAAR